MYERKIKYKRSSLAEHSCIKLKIAVPSFEGTTNIPSLVVPSFDSTPFCENRYQKTAVLAERCCFICKENAYFRIIRGNVLIFSVCLKEQQHF